MTTATRHRNSRPSKYRPRTEAQKERRKVLVAARADDRAHQGREAEEADLQLRLVELETALRDQGHGGVHLRRNTRPLESITDDVERFGVLKARVERLEALWSIDRRKRETRGKIVLGGAILAELNEAAAAQDRSLMATILSVLDRRVETVRDRLTVRDLLGGAPLPLRRGGSPDENLGEALVALNGTAMVSNLAEMSAVADDDERMDEELQLGA